MTSPSEWDRARSIITSVCHEIGFPPPAPEDTIVDWADASVDHSLAPRGAEHWYAGKQLLMSALDAALLGDENHVKIMLSRVRKSISDHALRSCACEPRPVKVKLAGDDRHFCAKCHLRQR